MRSVIGGVSTSMRTICGYLQGIAYGIMLAASSEVGEIWDTRSDTWWQRTP